jgi:hypothetical protein
LTYTHNGSVIASDSFTYTIKDSDGNLSNEAPVSITVTPVNDAPTTSGIADITLDEDPGVSFLDLKAVFADAEDADLTLIYTITGNTNSTLFDTTSIDGSGILTLDYAADENGTSDITIRATDTGGLFV